MVKKQPALLYETSILSSDSDHFFQATTIPKCVFPMNARLKRRKLLEDLGFSSKENKARPHLPTDAFRLAWHLAFLLSGHRRTSDERWAALECAIGEERPAFAPTSEDIQFAEIVAFEPIVHIGKSQHESLAHLATTVRGLKSRAFARFVSYRSIPLLVLHVPAGLVVCGEGGDVGDAFYERGLKNELFAWLKGETPETRSRASFND